MELFKSRTRVAYTNAVGDKVYPVVVDIKKGIKSTEDIQFVSSDVNTGILSVAFISGNENFNVSGADVVCSVMRPDASTLELPCEVVRENIVEVPLGINGTSQDGVYSFDFKVLKGGNKVIGTPIMNYSVSLSIGNDMVVEEDDRLPVLTMLMTQLAELKGEARESINQANVATEASREATANAIEATNKANETVNKVTQDTANAIANVNATSDTMVENVNNAISSMDTTVNSKISEMTDVVNNKISEVDIAKNEMINDVSSTKANMVTEVTNAKNEITTTVSNKVNEVENRFNALTSSQQQDAEVIDARDGETSLKARLDRDIEKAKQVYVNVEGSHISTDSSSGYLKDVEILGNTIQDPNNLADIRSVGDKVEGQELYEIPVLSCGKNLFNTKKAVSTTGVSGISVVATSSDMILISTSGAYNMLPINYNLKPNTQYILKGSHTVLNGNGRPYCEVRDINGVLLGSNGWKLPVQFTTDNTGFVKILFGCNDNENNASIRYYNIQLEEGTVVTPYEPYVEDKLTILSPVQLEKVGDVADRIIEKDGVWGVEKNIKTDLLKGGDNENFRLNKVLDKGGYQFTWFAIMGATANKNSEVISSTMNSYVGSNEEYSSNIWIYDGVAYVIHHPTISTADEIKLWLQANPTIVKFALNTPQFIPLPHDQQIKLRTFANKTNISFGCEIEGTIKAQVPKSLGATVNTHTEQINNLNKELDRVKKLEESTVSTVTTESDFTTVEATSNGYFEDVKLEGKTLVNLISATRSYISSDNTEIHKDVNTDMTTSKTLTIQGKANKVILLEVRLNGVFSKNIICTPVDGFINTKIVLSSGENIRRIKGISVHGWSPSEELSLFNDNFILLEGDHTQNPPSYFEGLKSVGQETDEIVVSSVKGDGNLFRIEDFKISSGDGVINQNSGTYTTMINKDNHARIKIKVKPNTEYIVNCDAQDRPFQWRFRDINQVMISPLVSPYDTNTIHTINTGNNEYIYVELFQRVTDSSYSITFSNIYIGKSGGYSQYTPLQSDKKRLLYYNNETQTWEKPILREWDSIEKHADGKYYYHQRSGEVVLNGSEDWREFPKPFENTIAFQLHMPLVKHTTDVGIVADKIQGVSYLKVNIEDVEGISLWDNQSFIRFRISKSKLSTQDVQGFKQCLQANNVTAVYQLAQEKVYECTNIDLITYANETNYIVESGVLSPKTTLKVHNNISNVVSLLQKKVSLLESNVKASQEVQDMMILETDMRMLDIELALMEFAPMKLNLGGSNMLRSATYFNFVKNHIINETYEKEYLENVMNKYLATGRINQDEYDELYKMLYPPVYDIELPIER